MLDVLRTLAQCKARLFACKVKVESSIAIAAYKLTSAAMLCSRRQCLCLVSTTCKQLHEQCCTSSFVYQLLTVIAAGSSSSTSSRFSADSFICSYGFALLRLLLSRQLTAPHQ
jgi:hypothetical protein